jgi:hypothetical protein
MIGFEVKRLAIILGGPGLASSFPKQAEKVISADTGAILVQAGLTYGCRLT